MAREGFPIILVSWLVTIAFFCVGHFFHHRPVFGAGIFLALISVFILFFFRDPSRIIPNIPGAVVAPADGRILEVKEVEETEFIKGKAIRISTFLSVFNVHVNRVPVGGVIRYKRYNPGKFFAAFNDKASAENEQTTIGIETKAGVKIVVKQIAGLIARRIVCHADSGMTFDVGQRFGIIRFGSRAELFLPLGTKIEVKAGDKVKAGSSILGAIQ